MKKLSCFFLLLLFCKVVFATEPESSYAKSIQLIDIGMYNTPVDLLSFMNKPIHKNSFSRQDSAMVAWAHVSNVKKDDQQTFVFYSPDGNVYGRAIEEKIIADQEEWFAVGGYLLRNKNIPKAYNGEWRVVYLVKRGDTSWQEVGETRFSLKD